MATFVRTLLRDFILANRLYAGCRLYVYEADTSGLRTDVLAQLWDSRIGGAALENPQTLDNEGKNAQPIYFEDRIVWVVDGLSEGTNESGVIEPNVSSTDIDAAAALAHQTTAFALQASESSDDATAAAIAAAAAAAAALLVRSQVLALMDERLDDFLQTVLNAYGTQAEVDGGVSARVVLANTLLASRIYGQTFRNLVINGGFEVWQRGAGGAASIAVAATSIVQGPDRFYLATGANQASVMTQVSPLVNGSRFAARIQRNAAQAGVGVMVFAIPFELEEIHPLRTKVLTVSFQARGGANWSPTNGTLSYILYVGTGAAGKRNATPYTTETSPLTGSINLTAGGAVTPASAISITVPATTTQAELQFFWTPVGAAGANDYFEIDDLELEVSGAATIAAPTAFERVPFLLELMRCQRQFYKSFPYATAPAQNVGVNTGTLTTLAIGAGANQVIWPHRFPVPMVRAPTITTFNPAAANAAARDASVAADCSVPGFLNISTEGVTLTAIGNAGTVVTSNLQVHITADSAL